MPYPLTSSCPVMLVVGDNAPAEEGVVSEGVGLWCLQGGEGMVPLCGHARVHCSDMETATCRSTPCTQNAARTRVCLHVPAWSTFAQSAAGTVQLAMLVHVCNCVCTLPSSTSTCVYVLVDTWAHTGALRDTSPSPAPHLEVGMVHPAQTLWKWKVPYVPQQVVVVSGGSELTQHPACCGMCWSQCQGSVVISMGNFCQAQGTPGCSYRPSHPQVDCNSKLDPTNTTFLKVSRWQGGSRVAPAACVVPCHPVPQHCGVSPSPCHRFVLAVGLG